MGRELYAAVVLAAIAVAGCSFAGQAIADDTPAIDAARVDGIPATCGDEGDFACDGRLRRECGPDHQWLPNPAACDFTCVAGECVAASNVGSAAVAACGPTAPRLAPATGSVTITSPSGVIKVTCSDGCGDGVDEILATRITGNPGLGWFCLRSIDLPSNVAVGLPGTGGPAVAIAFIVDGAVAIAGGVGLDGLAATPTAFGEGAPGGEDGGGLAGDDSPGVDGTGPCAGSGGAAVIMGSELAGGGGGGGGHAQTGGSGGGGSSASDSYTAPGGPGGIVCGDPDVAPLVGGSGGGGGGDGICGGLCGWPGGGGGGALQISSRVSIAITSKVSARGGDGYGVLVGSGSQGGGGGGGAGGALLLEAPAVTVSGPITVDGGNGGASAAGTGGPGASAGTGPAPGPSHSGASEGGGGGGGAGGRVRIRAATPSCTNVSPTSACTTAAMP